MITKTRPLETTQVKVKEERRLDWILIRQTAIQLIFIMSTLYATHNLYIYVWRMATGH
jgi:hypothetical protein